MREARARMSEIVMAGRHIWARLLVRVLAQSIMSSSGPVRPIVLEV